MECVIAARSALPLALSRPPIPPLSPPRGILFQPPLELTSNSLVLAYSVLSPACTQGCHPFCWWPYFVHQQKHHFLQCYHTSTGGKSVLGHKVLYPRLYLRGAMLLLPLHRDEFKYTICHQQSGTAWSGILLYIRTDPFYVLNCDVTRQNNK